MNKDKIVVHDFFLCRASCQISVQVSNICDLTTKLCKSQIKKKKNLVEKYVNQLI
jgi:hypothetical protein